MRKALSLLGITATAAIVSMALLAGSAFALSGPTAGVHAAQGSSAPAAKSPKPREYEWCNAFLPPSPNCGYYMLIYPKTKSWAEKGNEAEVHGKYAKVGKELVFTYEAPQYYVENNAEIKFKKVKKSKNYTGFFYFPGQEPLAEELIRL
jgi:hypothetical protein